MMRYEDGWWPNALALAYVLGAYLGGVGLIVADSFLANVTGVLLLAHALVIAAYLIHECIHNTLFTHNEHNARLGTTLSWLTGSCYSPYEVLRHKHFRHHIERADVVAFDYRPRFARHPRILRVVLQLEWLYVPALEVCMHALATARPFRSQDRIAQWRVLAILLVRVGLFAALAWYSPAALLRYALAYLLFLTVMRFMDAFQHTYDVFETLDQARGPDAARFDRVYEQRNTFSNLLSARHPWLNLLTLNFAYHNAHHAHPASPWYRLPALHRALYGNDDKQVLPFGTLVRMYHRYRVARVLNTDPPDSGVAERRGAGFVGVDGVSFLVPI
jgi:fatty acid desaturase